LNPNNYDTAETNFTIEVRDKHGKPMTQGGDNFVVDIQVPTGPVEFKLVDNRDSTYNVVYTLDDAIQGELPIKDLHSTWILNQVRGLATPSSKITPLWFTVFILVHKNHLHSFFDLKRN